MTWGTGIGSRCGRIAMVGARGGGSSALRVMRRSAAPVGGGKVRPITRLYVPPGRRVIVRGGGRGRVERRVGRRLVSSVNGRWE